MEKKEPTVCSESAANNCEGSEEKQYAEKESEDSAVSMLDVLEEQAQLEEDANAVLGGSDHLNCTYPLGYVPRQAVYACGTCQNNDTEPAGICLACSYECHEGHELIELYTKRLFRCDCGNEKFPDNKCKLFKDKAPHNTENKYNQNYRGLYCICKRPYPDPEDEVPDEMLQCVICEDWFHGRHLKSKLPEHHNYDEMVCTQCMQEHQFLWAYTAQNSDTIKLEVGSASSSEHVNVETVKTEDKEQGTSTSEATSEESTKQEEKSGCREQEENMDTCQLAQLRQGKPTSTGEGSVFWPAGWRTKLCTCDSCKRMYDEKGVSYLLDESDTVSAYEQKNKSISSQYEQGMQQLTQMDRIQQVEMISSYNDMKEELKDYLKKFAENGKVVREEDIQEFFTNMKAKKRQRTAPSVQYFCR